MITLIFEVARMALGALRARMLEIGIHLIEFCLKICIEDSTFGSCKIRILQSILIISVLQKTHN